MVLSTVRVNEPGGQKEHAWHQGASEGDGPEQACPRNSRTMSRTPSIVSLVRRCKRSYGGGGGGAREDTEGNSNHRPLRILGFQASFVPVPPRETPSWEPDFHRLANQGMAKNVTRLVSCDGRPSSPCAKTTPAQATPTRQALAAATPPAFPREAKRPLTPFATSRASRAVLESSLHTHIPGVAGVNFREQKSCLQTMQNFGAQRLRYCHKLWLKLSLRGGCPGRSRLRGRLPTPRSTDFSAAPGLLFPRLRADKSHACTKANETGRQQKPPDPPPN